MVFPLTPRRIDYGDFLFVDIDVKTVGTYKSLINDWYNVGDLDFSEITTKICNKKNRGASPVFRFFAAFICHNVRVSRSFLTLFA